MIGVFVSLDLLLFYLFFEASLVPMFFLIGIWGGERRIYAAVKFFIYTAVGSLLMLVGIIALYFIYHTFDYPTLLQAISSEPLSEWTRAEFWLFLAFALAFCIKVPLFPFHTWLPDAHTEAPTAGSVILAGVLLKMGTYGLLRFNLALFPNAARVVGACDHHTRGDRHHLRRARRDGPARRQTARRLFVGESHGIRRARVCSLLPSSACRARFTRCSITAFRPARSSSSSASFTNDAIRA